MARRHAATTRSGRNSSPTFDAASTAACHDEIQERRCAIASSARSGRSLSVRDLVELLTLFDGDHIALAFLDMNINTGTSQGRYPFNETFTQNA
jgi:DNA invertase Pin-like site-specific DNA recombinase